MGKFFCHCLNVHISIKSTDIPSTEPSVSDFSSTDEFFSAKLSEVQLSLEGVTFEHPYLVRTWKVGDWTLHKCMSCEHTTHATHNLPGSGKVLINTEQLSDASTVEALRKSPDFCPLYKIIIHSRNDNEKVRSLGVQSEKYESLQKTLGEIQQQLNTFLVQEEAAMEDRIKCYMESQRTAYAELQSKVRRHKNTMVNLVLLSEQRQISESLSDAMTDSPTSPLSPTHAISSEDLTGSEAEASQVSQAKRPSAFGRGLDDVPITKTKKMPSLSERLKMGSGFKLPAQESKITSTVDPDGDLDFDSAFQDDNNQPFYNSDDETEDTDDSESEQRGRRLNKDQSSLYSASVPISVPMWGRPIGRKSFAEDVEEEDLLPQDAASMAASIKALAQSVHGDGTEMFGELPRPRLNTSNFAVP